MTIWAPGMKAECLGVRDLGYGLAPIIPEKGVVYTVAKVHPWAPRREWGCGLQLAEIPGNVWWFASIFFRPVGEPEETDISIFEEMLKPVDQRVLEPA